MKTRSVLAIALVVACGCGSDVDRKSPARDGERTSKGGSEPRREAASTSASAQRSAAPRAPSRFDALRAQYGKPVSKTGKGVRCGDVTCADDELCCAGEAGRTPTCTKKGAEASCKESGGLTASCDESSDCPEDELCCLGATKTGTLVTCATKQRCSEAWDGPGQLMIPAREVCAPGGTCKTPGRVCVHESCLSSKARVACGTSEDCPSDAPWCFWDSAAKRGECVERGPWAGEPGVFECDGVSDCPGGACCGSGRNMTEQSFCGTVECTPDLAYAARLCRTDADCVLDDGRKVPCSLSSDTLPGIGTCSW